MPIKLYQSPPNSGSNDGAAPQNYDPLWQAFVNLTPSQILAFQSFPQDLIKYTSIRRWQAELSGVTVGGIPLTTDSESQSKISQLKQAFDTGAISQVSFKDATGNFHSVDLAAATAVYTGVVQFIQALRDAEATIVTGINGSTITTRKQIDAAIGPLAPSSVSATNPSPT